jgi:phage terminase Nu1 subunit (DNA packaging protein)
VTPAEKDDAELARVLFALDMIPATPGRIASFEGVSAGGADKLRAQKVFNTNTDSLLAALRKIATYRKGVASGRGQVVALNEDDEEGELIDATREKALLARVQRERIELQNAMTRRESAPVALLEMALAEAGNRVQDVFREAIVATRRNAEAFGPEVVDLVQAAFDRALTTCSEVKLDLSKLDAGEEADEPTE